MIAILDLDGTLVDSNYQHALAWFRALRDHGVVTPVWRLHRAIGMGGDQLVAHVCGAEVEEQVGDAVRESHTARYAELIDEVQPLEGARDLILDLRRRGHRLVLASSASEDEAGHYLGLLGARTLVDAWTTSADVAASKPQPDVVGAALEKVGGEAAEGVVLGDSIWDIEAAKAAGVPAIAVLMGGYSAGELEDAGAVHVAASIPELLEALEDTPLG